VAEVEVGLRPIVRHIDLTMLEGTHGTRIHVDVGIQLDHRHPESTGLEECCQGSGRNTFAKGGDYPARNKYKFSHENFSQKGK